ncbi:hypothetical protein [Tunicatimonas pelagia]|uniref:hypothetical protein n=1 Tax=Tunicatimonas pelagia TaxID=931531 RepID=UPI002665DB8C|nr:hypothetical protein [Tunicatimonas pelagia]WKN44202.1 hypothetical protein P0M28_04375 [Tunicatimonas pelagia]
MKRRDFVKKGTALGASWVAVGSANQSLASCPSSFSKNRLLNAYYFRAHMYTMVPRQVREDMEWMADLGTHVVTIAVLEQDLFAAVENIEIVCREAERVGMAVHAVPSRWAGIFAGAPKVPSLFSVLHPDTWVLKKDGTPLVSSVSGVISSIHHPATYKFFCESLTTLLEQWPIRGIMWDEPKSYGWDYSPQAVEALGAEASFEDHLQATTRFHSRLNQFVKKNYPHVTTSLFDQAHYSDQIVAAVAQVEHLDYLGCDGRPWYDRDGGREEGRGKNLLGEQAGERFLKAARASDKKTLWLIENHNLATKDIDLMNRRLPEIVAQGVDQLIYYYYPRSVAEPDRAMHVIKKHLRNYGQ